MTLEDANKKMEELDNEYNYWLNEKERLLSLVMPKPVDTTQERVDGGKRVDKYLKYVELEDEKQINNTLEYIHQAKINLMNWIDTELKIQKKYNNIKDVIIYLKEKELIQDKKTGVVRHLTWKEISSKVGYHQDHVRRIYRLEKKRRFIDK